MASNNKIILNDDADLIAETYGLYNVNDCMREQERNIILCGYDGYEGNTKNVVYIVFVRFTNSSTTTGTSMIQIDNKRLTIVIATTGDKLMKNMKNWINYTVFDGTHNRFLLMSIPKLFYYRPQE